jgi:Predicted RNA polymerase sigma factor containing a TPR repeat domain
VALTLRMVGGLTVPEIARAFLVQETASGRRITRAKAKIKAARIPYRVPSAEDLPARVSGVLAVLSSSSTRATWRPAPTPIPYVRT